MSLDARHIANAWLAGEWTLDGLRERTCRLIGRERLTKGLEKLVGGFWRDLREAPQARRLAPLVQAIGCHPGYRRLRSRLDAVAVVPGPAAMSPIPHGWQLPPLPTMAALATWLGLDIGELEWLADRAAIGDHYDRYWQGKRLIEAPRPRLKAAQRRLLDGLIARVPAHEAAHGFRRWRSVLTAVVPHTGQPMVAVMDLRAFFPSLRASRVHALFQYAGYPEGVARTLTRLCTTACLTLPPRGSRHEASPAETFAARQLYRTRHLPQGAPTSPALANLCAYRLDARLSGVAAVMKARYTRYADDLIFSGGRRLRRGGFAGLVARIVREEGFELNPDKTRAMGRSTRQLALGLVLNERPALPRADLERLEAILVNCIRHGPESQHPGGSAELRPQLVGRVAWARHVDAERARHLVDLLARIDWQRPSES